MMSNQRKYFRLILVFVIVMITISLVYMIKLPAKDPKWLIVGNVLKTFSSTSYEAFKNWQQKSRLEWFEDVAQKEELPLHAASGYGYMSEVEFSEMVSHVLQEMPIKSSDSVFEMGCGVGAVLKIIRFMHGETVSVGGSDLSQQAVSKIRAIFPNDTANFYVLPMTEKNFNIPDNSKDHVISFGAIAMYLYKEQMVIALQEALRICKPGGHLCFTHFVEPSGVLKGSILEPVEKSFWIKLTEKYSLENVIVKQMIHQKDRYFVCFSKPLE